MSQGTEPGQTKVLKYQFKANHLYNIESVKVKIIFEL